MWTGPDFHGAKIVLLCDGALLCYLRDDKPEIPAPGQWDLPGGGREGQESTLECVLREVREEFAFRPSPAMVIWQRFYPGSPPGLPGYYCLGGAITPQQVAAIRFGEEGQHWRLMPVAEFIEHPAAVPNLRGCVVDFLNACGA